MFVDTPGVHKPANLLDKRMLQEVYGALETRDVVLHVVDVTRRLRLPEVKQKVTEIDLDAPAGEEIAAPAVEPQRSQQHSLENEDVYILEMVKKLECPVFLVLNKIDAIDTKESLLPLIAQFSGLHKLCRGDSCFRAVAAMAWSGW